MFFLFSITPCQFNSEARSVLVMQDTAYKETLCVPSTLPDMPANVVD